jgi:hypothetical protein
LAGIRSVRIVSATLALAAIAVSGLTLFPTPAFCLALSLARFWTGVAPIDVTSFSPTHGAPGTTVDIKGKNFTGVLGVVVGGATATLSKASTSTKLVVTIPSGAETGPVTVGASSGQAVPTKLFTVS